MAFEKVKFNRQLQNGPALQIDREQMRRAVINIITNAIQSYNDSEDQEKEIFVSTEFSETEACIKITDKGEGISPEIVENLFEPLFSTKIYGIGLGLPIVKDILEEHGGSVSIQSEKNSGTTVLLHLPLA